MTSQQISSIRIKNLRPTHAIIDLDRLANNINIARRYSNSDIIAIVKADGYGHGAKQIARHAFECCGVKNFGVATVEEGFTLRRDMRDSDVRIIVLGYVDEVFYSDVVANRLTLTVYDYQMAACLHAYLEENRIDLPISLKIDTGMARLGFSPDLDLEQFSMRFPRFIIRHIMSHLSSSDSDEEYSKFQENLFKDFLRKNRGFCFDTSLYNSAAIINFKNTFSLTRPGLLLYGYSSGGKEQDLKPVMSIKSKVIHTTKLKRGDTVSYNRRFTADRDMFAGVVPIGYADGYRRGLSNKGAMFIDGVRCPIIGTVCMDMTMIDVSCFGENAAGMDVEILGDHISAEDIAKCVGTIEYEILCGISTRIPRLYKTGESE